ncbi:hypothetical protein K8I85_07200 [bacterium]|nr:hypothetical protein [bacterium]
MTNTTGYYQVRTTGGGWDSLGPFTKGPTEGDCQYHTDFQTATDSTGYAHCVFEAHHYNDYTDTTECVLPQDFFIGYKSQSDGTWSPAVDPTPVSLDFPSPCVDDPPTCPRADSPSLFLAGNDLHILWGEDGSQWHRVKDLSTGLWSNRTRLSGVLAFVVDSRDTVHILGKSVVPGQTSQDPETHIVWHRFGVPPAGEGDWWTLSEPADTLDTWIQKPAGDPCSGASGPPGEEEGREGIAVCPEASGTRGNEYIYFAWNHRAECRPWEKDLAFATLDVTSSDPAAWVQYPTTMLSEVEDGRDARIGGIAADSTGIHVVWHELDLDATNFQLSEWMYHRYTPLQAPSDSTDWTAVEDMMPEGGTIGLFRPRPALRDNVLHVAYAQRDSAYTGPGWRFEVFYRQGRVVADSASMDWSGSVFLDRDFVVPADSTLTIQPGTVVRVASDDRENVGADSGRVEIIVRDGARVVATSSDPATPIVFRGAEAGAGNWSGISLEALASAQTGYGFLACDTTDCGDYCSNCDAEKSEFRNVVISDAEYGLSIEGNVAPDLNDVSFHDITNDRDIYLANGDVVVPVDFEWNLKAPTHVVAKTVTDLPDSLNLDYIYGTEDRIDLVFDGALTTSSAFPGSTFVTFRPDAGSAATADEWGGVTLIPSGSTRSIQDADFAYAANPLFVYYPDSTIVLRRSKIHHFADVGLWIKGDFGTGVVIGDSLTVERGFDLDKSLGRVGVQLDEADKLSLFGNTVRLEAGVFAPTSPQSRAIQIYIGKTKCESLGGNQRTLSIDGNVLEGPGIKSDNTAGVASGIYSDWVCGGSYRDVEYTNNLIQDFDLHGMEFYQSSDIQVGCNDLRDNWQSVEHRRDSEPTGAGVRFRSNVFSTPSGPPQMVRTDNALKTKLGGTGDKGNNRFWTNGVNDKYPRFLMEDEPGNSYALNASKCGWFADSTRITIPTSIDTVTFIWTTLLPDSLAGSGDPDEPKVNVNNPNTGFLDECGGSARQGRGPWSAVASPAEQAATGAPIADVPTVTSIGLPFPNPSRGPVRVDLAISPDHAGRYRVRIYDIGGRLVETLLDREASAGRYRVEWPRRSGARGAVAPGVYFVRTTGPGVERNSKLVVLR